MDKVARMLRLVHIASFDFFSRTSLGVEESLTPEVGLQGRLKNSESLQNLGCMLANLTDLCLVRQMSVNV